MWLLVAGYLSGLWWDGCIENLSARFDWDLRVVAEWIHNYHGEDAGSREEGGEEGEEGRTIRPKEDRPVRPCPSLRHPGTTE